MKNTQTVRDGTAYVSYDSCCHQSLGCALGCVSLGYCSYDPTGPAYLNVYVRITQIGCLQ